MRGAGTLARISLLVLLSRESPGQPLPMPCEPGTRRCFEGSVRICETNGHGWREAFCGAESVCLAGACYDVAGSEVVIPEWRRLLGTFDPPPGRSIVPEESTGDDVYHADNGLSYRFVDERLPEDDDDRPKPYVVRWERAPVSRQDVWRSDLTRHISVVFAKLSVLKTIEEIISVSPWGPLDRMSRGELDGRAPASSVTPDGRLALAVTFFPPVELETVRGVVETLDAEVSPPAQSASTFAIRLSPSALRDLLLIEDVWSVTPHE